VGSLFSTPSTPKPPPVPEPVPIPEVEEDSTIQKSMRKRKGMAQTILTGDLIPADTGQTTLLGGR
jgi:hypothetical protein